VTNKHENGDEERFITEYNKEVNIIGKFVNGVRL